MKHSDKVKAVPMREELQSMQALVNNLAQPLCMVNPDLTVVLANAAAIKLLREHERLVRSVWPGLNLDALLGVKLTDCPAIPPEEIARIKAQQGLPFSKYIAVGDEKFNVTVTPLYGNAKRFLGCTIEWWYATDYLRNDEAVNRLQSAIAGAHTNLMLCDSNLQITYANSSCVQTLGARAEEIRKVYPGFDENRLVGQSIEGFHPDPQAKRALLADPSRLPLKEVMRFGDIAFEVHTTAILRSKGKYLGNMVEWRDITEQLKAEQQIEGMVYGAARGKLDRRIETEKFEEGYLKELAKGVNKMLDAIIAPVMDASRVLQGVADGDLSQHMEGNFEGDFAVLRDVINTCTNHLKDMVIRIQETAHTINAGAAEIAQGNADLSSRTEEQASSLEETASSMEELAGTVKQNADNARQASKLAAEARTQAGQGGEAVKPAIAAMGEINRASKQIADIIGVIDEIAFQTNLLALNAAVEAARAGEHGRGFAVVASEVRNLAQRSAGAAKEIKALIKDSAEKVQEGTRLVNQSGVTLEGIVTSVKRLSDIVEEVTAASQEQALGIDQVNRAITQMDQVTQQNAALVEEMAAASESMSEQSLALTQLIAFFNVGDQQARTSAAERAGGEHHPQRPAATAPHEMSAVNRASPKARVGT